MNIRILIADDHNMVRDALKHFFVNTEIQVIAEAATVEATLRLAVEEEIDLMLLDIKMPDGNGLDALDRIKSAKPDLAVLIHSFADSPNYVARSMALGANGYLIKGVKKADMLEGIRTASKGGTLWTPEQHRMAMTHGRRKG